MNVTPTRLPSLTRAPFCLGSLFNPSFLFLPGNPVYAIDAPVNTFPWYINFIDTTAQWIWYAPNGHSSDQPIDVLPANFYFFYNNPDTMTEAKFFAHVDNVADIYLNNVYLGTTNNHFQFRWDSPVVKLVSGPNVIMVAAKNWGGPAAFIFTAQRNDGTRLFNSGPTWTYCLAGNLCSK